ncbi:hypothetical protein MKW98_019524, partial [Papaver atlanticum]
FLIHLLHHHAPGLSYQQLPISRWQKSLSRFRHIFGLNHRGRYPDIPKYYISGNHYNGYSATLSRNPKKARQKSPATKEMWQTNLLKAVILALKWTGDQLSLFLILLVFCKALKKNEVLWTKWPRLGAGVGNWREEFSSIPKFVLKLEHVDKSCNRFC